MFLSSMPNNTTLPVAAGGGPGSGVGGGAAELTQNQPQMTPSKPLFPNQQAFEEEQLELQSWFWPDASRGSAESALSQQPLGSFLVRPSSQPMCMALSHVIKDGKVGHALIVKQGDVVALERTDREFSSIEQLVGMLNLTPVPLPPAQKEALDQRRRNAAVRRNQRQQQYMNRIHQYREIREAEERERMEQEERQRAEQEERLRAEEDSRHRLLQEKRALLAKTPQLKQRTKMRSDAYMSAQRFNREEIDSLHQAFDEIDSVRVGGFTKEDIRNVLDQMGEVPNSSEVDAFMREIDGDHNGIVTFDEFLDAVDKLGDEANILLAEAIGDDSASSRPRVGIQRSARRIF